MNILISAGVSVLNSAKKANFKTFNAYYAGWMNTNSRVKLIVHFIPNLSRFLIIIICSTSADFHHILRLDFLCGIIFHQCLDEPVYPGGHSVIKFIDSDYDVEFH